MLLTPKIVANEALRILKSNLVFRDLVYNDYANEFQKVGDTVNVRKRFTANAHQFDGSIEVQDIDEEAVPVKLDRIRDVSVPLTSKEQTLDLKSFSDQVIAPAMVGIAEKVDEDIAAFITGAAKTIIPATEEPTNLEDIAKLGKTLDKNKAPKMDRSLVFAPDHKYAYALTDNLSKVSYAGDNETLREALLGKIYGFNTYMDQNNMNTNAATAGTATGYKVAGNKGEKTVTLSTFAPSSGTIKAGDGFIVDGHIYRFTQDKTASGTDVASVTIDEKLHKQITTGDTITLVNKPVSVAFQKEGIAFVTRPLELPMGAAKAYVAQADNIAVRVVFDYDINAKKDIVSFDVLYGIATLNDKLIAKLQ